MILPRGGFTGCEKTDTEGGGGFNPRIMPTQSIGPLGPERCFWVYLRGKRVNGERKARKTSLRGLCPKSHHPAQEVERLPKKSKLAQECLQSYPQTMN